MVPRRRRSGRWVVADHDALVGAAAAHHRLPFTTLDRRAVETYRAFDVEIEILE